jgi:D-sedoheptulose 7-phosphate isomerase
LETDIKKNKLFNTFNEDIVGFSKKYFHELNRVVNSTDLSSLVDFCRVITNAHNNDKIIYVFGNGGSAAIANHLLCDHSKGIGTLSEIHPRVVSLSSSAEIITALLNDVGSEEVFVGQLKNILREDDVCIAISSSGNSPNILAAVEYAKKKGAKVLGLVGFEGGKLSRLADYNIHVPINNYGIVEDVHQSLMHIMAQHIRALALKKLNIDIDRITY